MLWDTKCLPRELTVWRAWFPVFPVVKPMASELYAIIGAAAMFFGVIAAAFIVGINYESHKKGAEYAEQMRKMLNALDDIRGNVDSGELPLKYRD